MYIYEALNINEHRKDVITFVGAGGKTSTMFNLGEELKKLNKKVLITTTTCIYKPCKKQYDNLFIGELLDDLLKEIKEGSITVIGSYFINENKLKGISSELIDSIVEKNIFDFILIEGDGARRKSIKAPDFYEPIIPIGTSKTVGVIGMDSIGKEINEDNVHRTELFCKITESKIGQIIGEDTVVKLIENKNGLFKGVPKNSERYLLLNKADSLYNPELVYNIIKNIDFKHAHMNCIIGINMKSKNYKIEIT
ncbi:selenium cofactor biosynthesis protein YqeC [Clostridium tetanomorphum]|uniref:Selenium-dependent hydroxylase accessory protein YqeC n=1 Tax=Clostridium tetanomorphum TaxID=1553 RepID=A0A923E8K6_CLOTT|nr:selenium cofactor biosynthesis protein YqeC [Clostridium tetanomorphum]MBC2397069.1 putative selenium-dependent hydroxylase accessory protein YqeC [Clostridium tetanomorphum]NRZ99087.1 putative selenium-dependent hydroxylase accessory protein YqeC [Clostridium tetanomorphum]